MYAFFKQYFYSRTDIDVLSRKEIVFVFASPGSRRLSVLVPSCIRSVFDDEIAFLPFFFFFFISTYFVLIRKRLYPRHTQTTRVQRYLSPCPRIFPHEYDDFLVRFPTRDDLPERTRSPYTRYFSDAANVFRSIPARLVVVVVVVAGQQSERGRETDVCLFRCTSPPRPVHARAFNYNSYAAESR